jgi:hypothetical protein
LVTVTQRRAGAKATFLIVTNQDDLLVVKLEIIKLMSPLRCGRRRLADLSASRLASNQKLQPEYSRGNLSEPRTIGEVPGIAK